MRGCIPLTEAEISKLSEVAEISDELTGLIFNLGLHSGARVSEMLSIAIGDVYDLESGLAKKQVNLKARSTKTRTGRLLFINAKSAAAITAYIKHLRTSGVNIQPDTSLFLNVKTGRAYTKAMIWIYWRKLLKNAGVDLPVNGLHTLRKTFARRVYEKSARDINATSELLGHASLASTTHYLASNVDQMRALVNSL